MTIAVTNLDFIVAIRLLIKSKDCTVLYYKKNIPESLYKILERRHNLKEFNKRRYPEYHENIKNQKEIFRISSEAAENPSLFNFIKEISDIFHIKPLHIKNAIAKYFIKIIDDDITFVNLIKDKYDDGKIEYWLENYLILEGLSNLNIKLVNPANISIFHLMLACYISAWPGRIFLFFVNNICKKKNRDKKENIKVVFQQIYKKRFGGNPEFDAFFRYFKTRDDVLYFCKKKGDEIYQSVISEGKSAFTARDIRLPLPEVLSFYHILFKLISSLLKQGVSKKIIFWSIILYFFREYVITKSILLQYSPEYFIRIRSEAYENHPITTGVCELFGCSHIGHEHGPPARFVAYYAVADFHYLGVMGKSSVTDIYKDYRQNIRWSVLGPKTADICYELPVPASDKKIVMLVADFWIWPDWIHPYEGYFEEALLPLIDFIKDKKEIRLLTRLKCEDKNKEAYVRNLCRGYNIDYEAEYTHSGTDIRGFSSYTVKKSELVVIRGSSTIAWECLSLGKKLIIFPNNWIEHPLTSFTPKLAVRNIDEFNKTISWLWEMPYPEYARKTAHIVEQISKKANGKMVQEYFEDFVGIDRK